MLKRWQRFHRILKSGVLALSVLFFPLAATAQSPQVMEQFRKGPHTASIETALVGIEVINFEKDGPILETRHGNGLVLRSDGFILVPRALISMTITGTKTVAPKQQITVFTRPGTKEEQRFLPRYPRFLASEYPDKDS